MADNKVVSTEIDQSVGQTPVEVVEPLIQPGSVSADGVNDDASSIRAGSGDDCEGDALKKAI